MDTDLLLKTPHLNFATHSVKEKKKITAVELKSVKMKLPSLHSFLKCLNINYSNNGIFHANANDFCTCLSVYCAVEHKLA